MALFVVVITCLVLAVVRESHGGVSVTYSTVVEGELSSMFCPLIGRGGRTIWITPSNQQINVNNGLLISGRELIILAAEEKHSGVYTCVGRNTKYETTFVRCRHLQGEEKELCRQRRPDKSTAKFVITVEKPARRFPTFAMFCFVGEQCKLGCPDDQRPTTIQPTKVTWTRTLTRMLDEVNHEVKPDFGIAKLDDEGRYMCSLTYIINNASYHLRHEYGLVVKKDRPKRPQVLSPTPDFTQRVRLGDNITIECTGLVYGEYDATYWQINNNSPSGNKTERVYCEDRTVTTTTEEDGTEKYIMKQVLVINNVNQNDITRKYSCVVASLSYSTTAPYYLVEMPKNATANN